jgi:peroxiredoxin
MSPAPQFSLLDTQGATRALSDYKGKVVLLNFMQPT